MMAINLKKVRVYLEQEVSNAPVITFRIIFGILMMISILRFALKGWIKAQYLDSKIYFHYFGFEWIKPLPAEMLYAVFALMFIAALFIAAGLFYRISAISFFLSFTYVELIDKTYYLNHYYFIILIAFLLIFMPANKRLSIDVHLGLTTYSSTLPRMFITLLRFQVGLVYFFAGIAKINSDWLLRAMPLKIWLAANANKPVLGNIFAKVETAYIFSWAGMLYDISIPFLLVLKKTRLPAFTAVVVFHLLTGWLFPIGIFPFVMIFSAFIFFSSSWHEKLIARLEMALRIENARSSARAKLVKGWWLAFAFYLMFQVLFPLRYLLYPGNLFWTEECYRFSWRVMLMEKMGNATFYVTDRETNKKVWVYNREHLTPIQEKMMATQPDMILQYAHYLKSYWERRGMKDPIVNGDVFVTLNGRKSKRFIDPAVDLASLEDGWSPKDWILKE